MLTQLSTIKSRLSIPELDPQYDVLLTNAIKAVSARFDRETHRTLARTVDYRQEFDPTDTDISISANGTITTNNGAKGRLQVVEFASPEELTREGNNLYAGGTPEPAVATRVMQGAIERSNVSGVAEMTEMIRVQRAYESLANSMKSQDELRRSAIQKLGELSA